jgi:phage antirepressor YoqD-like protein
MSDNEPYQQYMGTYFMIVEAKWNNPKTGSSHAVKQTRVTQRGIEWLTKNKEKFNL